MDDTFLFLILLIFGWVVAASLMAENTNVRMAVFIADITSTCGFGSDEAAALLSACSFVRCCNHQCVFYQRWLLCPARILPGYDGSFSCGTC